MRFGAGPIWRTEEPTKPWEVWPELGRRSPWPGPPADRSCWPGPTWSRGPPSPTWWCSLPPPPHWQLLLITSCGYTTAGTVGLSRIFTCQPLLCFYEITSRLTPFAVIDYHTVPYILVIKFVVYVQYILDLVCTVAIVMKNILPLFYFRAFFVLVPG